MEVKKEKGNGKLHWRLILKKTKDIINAIVGTRPPKKPRPNK